MDDQLPAEAAMEATLLFREWHLQLAFAEYLSKMLGRSVDPKSIQVFDGDSFVDSLTVQYLLPQEAQTNGTTDSNS